MSTQCGKDTSKGDKCKQKLKDGKCRFHGIAILIKKIDDSNIPSVQPDKMSPSISSSEILYSNDENEIKSKIINNKCNNCLKHSKYCGKCQQKNIVDCDFEVSTIDPPIENTSYNMAPQLQDETSKLIEVPKKCLDFYPNLLKKIN